MAHFVHYQLLVLFDSEDLKEMKVTLSNATAWRLIIMFITVMYRNGKIGMVELDQLDHLIQSGKVKQFMRGEGWVTIGIDSIREFEEEYKSPERRQFFKRTR